jgi:hypothetical protein
MGGSLTARCWGCGSPPRLARGQQRQSIGITGLRSRPVSRTTPPSGTRKWLYEHGLSYNFIYTNDVLSNLSGGIKRGTIDQGKLEAQLYIDLEKLAGAKGWTFYANAFGIYNDGRIRRDYAGGMNTIAAIEATPTGAVGIVAEAGLPVARFASSPRTRNSSTATPVRFSCRAIGRRSAQSICRVGAPPTRCRPSARG